MRTIFIIAGKDLLLRRRDRLGFFWWMVGFPLIIAVLIGTIFAGVLEGPADPMAVAVVDEDSSASSKAFLQTLRESEGLLIRELSLADARQAVRQGRLGGFIVLRKNFVCSPAILWGEPLPLAIGMDPSRAAESAYLRAMVQQAVIRHLRDQWVVDSAGREGVRLGDIETIALDTSSARPRSSFEICFPLGILWGLMGLAAEFAMGIVHEREAGTWLRLRAAPIRRAHVLGGNGVACLVACLGVMVFLLVVGRLFFGVRWQSPAALVMALPCIGLFFVGLTMLLSVLGRTESSVGGAAWACLLVMAVLGGGMVPQMFMPEWINVAGNLSPIKWAILALEGAIWRGFSVAEMVRPCGVLLAQGLICGAAGVAVSSRSSP
ncbi:MAG: ABC transporter permease [Phycisphaerales bacterium]|nr:ABC transporter permease [Phycisphaerales bacterium]